MHVNKKIWVGLFEDPEGRRHCKQFWVELNEVTEWSQIEAELPKGGKLLAIFPGRIPPGMRWSKVNPRERSDQQAVDVWDTSSFYP